MVIHMWSYQIVPWMFSIFLVLCMMACTLYEFYSEKGQVVSDHLMFHLTDTFKILSRLAYLLFYIYQPSILLSIFKTSATLSRASRTNWPSTLHQLSVDGILENEGQQTSMANISLAKCIHILSVIEPALDTILPWPSILPAVLYNLSRYGSFLDLDWMLNINSSFSLLSTVIFLSTTSYYCLAILGLIITSLASTQLFKFWHSNVHLPFFRLPTFALSFTICVASAYLPLPPSRTKNPPFKCSLLLDYLKEIRMSIF